MPKSKIKTKEYDDLGKGINVFTRDTMIKENESAAGYNVWAVGKNSIAKRPGITKLCTIAGGKAIDGLGCYYSGATRNLVAISNGVPYTIETGTAVTMSAVPASAGAFTAGKRHDFAQGVGNLFTANGVDKIRYFDGAWRENTANSIVASYLIFYKSCLWATGCPTVGKESSLYRSGDGATVNAAVGNFTYNVSTNPLATEKYVSQSDGQKLKGFFKHQDYLYPVKERSLWRCSVGTDAAQLITLEMVDPSRGCDSHFSIDSVDNDNFMFQEQGVMATGYEPNILDQLRTNIISLRIDNKIKAIEKSRLDDVCGIYFDNHYYLSYTSGGGGVNDTIMVYDRQRLGWWEFNIGANCFSEFKDSNGYTKLYFGDSTGNIYYFDAGVKSDNSSAILTQWKTGKLGFGNYAQSKFFLQTVLYFGKTPGNVTINVYIDDKLAKTVPKKIGNTGTAGIGNSSIGTYIFGVEGGSLTIADKGGGDFVPIPINKIGRNLQIEVTDNTSDKGWELNAYEVMYTELDNMFQPI
jgi:hypothetical protein